MLREQGTADEEILEREPRAVADRHLVIAAMTGRATEERFAEGGNFNVLRGVLKRADESRLLGQVAEEPCPCEQLGQKLLLMVVFAWGNRTPAPRMRIRRTYRPGAPRDTAIESLCYVASVALTEAATRACGPRCTRRRKTKASPRARWQLAVRLRSLEMLANELHRLDRLRIGLVPDDVPGLQIAVLHDALDAELVHLLLQSDA